MKNALIVIIISLLLVSCQNNNSIEISGIYSSGAGTSLTAELLNINETQAIDSATVSKSGKFSFRFKMDHPELVIIRNEAGENISLLVFPEDRISLTIQEKYPVNYEIEGSEESEKILALVKTVTRTRSALDSISEVFNELEDKESPKADILVEAYRTKIQNQKRNSIRFILENLNSLSSVYALYQRISPDQYVLNDLKDLQFFKIVSDSMSVKYPGSTLTRSLANDVKTRLTDYNNVIALNKLAEKDFVEKGHIGLNIPDPNNDTIALSDFLGKVILVNFWASWDAGSREATNSLKAIYNKYHNQGFEIYSVALESSLLNWRTAIDFEEYNWINVSELDYPYSYAANAYNVTSLPMNFIIDRQGNIVGKNIYGNVLATWLDNLL